MTGSKTYHDIMIIHHIDFPAGKPILSGVVKSEMIKTV